MIEGFVSVVVSRGLWFAVGALVGAAFTEQLHPLAKRIIEASSGLATHAHELGSEVLEKGQDFVAESREGADGQMTSPVPTRTPPRPHAATRVRSHASGLGSRSRPASRRKRTEVG